MGLAPLLFPSKTTKPNFPLPPPPPPPSLLQLLERVEEAVRAHQNHDKNVAISKVMAGVLDKVRVTHAGGNRTGASGFGLQWDMLL